MNRTLAAETRILLRLLAGDTPRSKPAAALHLAKIEAAQGRVKDLTPPKHSRKPARGWWRF